MSHFNYTKPAGVWTDGVDNLDATALASFEAKMFKAVNGDEGGSWAPSSAIAIGGSGLEVSGAGLTAGPMKLVSGSSYVADTAALKALTGMVTGQTCWVKQQGLYLYEDPDTTTEAAPWVISPTSGTGRWFHALYALKDIANGFVSTNSLNKISNTILPVQVAGFEGGGYAASHSMVPSVWTDTGAFVTIYGVKNGDRILANAHGSMQGTYSGAGGSATTSTRLLFATSGGPAATHALWPANQTMRAAFGLTGTYAVTAGDETAGSVTIKVQDNLGSAMASGLSLEVVVNAVLYRL